jgi:recombination protein RecA
MGLDEIIKGLQKKYGTMIVHLTAEEATDHVASIPTGLLPLDVALGVGGIPRGYFTEVYSPEGVGKTTLCLQVVGQAQKQGIKAAYIDMEHRLDPVWASTLGVDLSELYFAQPPYGEAALNISRALIKGGVGLIIIDSVPSLVPKTEWEAETGDQFVGLLPRMLSQNLRQMTHEISENSASVIFINQIRSKIGGGGSLAYGPQQTQPGGWALRHNASVRMDMRRIGTVKDGAEVIGQKVRVTIKKNSLSTPYRSADLILRFGVGFDPVESIIDLGLKIGIIDQSGSWYSIHGGDKVQGRQSVYALLSENKELYDKIYDEVRSKTSVEYSVDDED